MLRTCTASWRTSLKGSPQARSLRGFVKSLRFRLMRKHVCHNGQASTPGSGFLDLSPSRRAQRPRDTTSEQGDTLHRRLPGGGGKTPKNPCAALSPSRQASPQLTDDSPRSYWLATTSTCELCGPQACREPGTNRQNP